MGRVNRVSMSPNEMRNGKVETDEDGEEKGEIKMKIGGCRGVMVAKNGNYFYYDDSTELYNNP